MKALDRYLTRELLFPIIFGSLSLVFLILIADLFDNIDDFLKNHVPFTIILKYYVSLAPYAFTQTISWSCWLGTLFLLVSLGFHNETIAMKAAGLKITTIVKPVLFLGFLIGIATFLISDRVVPETYKTASELREIYVDRAKEKPSHLETEKVLRNVTYHAGGQQLVYFRSFWKSKGEGEGVVILWLSQAANSRQKMVAKKALWKKDEWNFYGVSEYQMDSRGRILGEPKTFPERKYSEINFTPNEMAAASTESTFMSYRDLKQSVEKLKQNGVSVTQEVVDLHYRLAFPWQGLVMMLITVPLMARTTTRKLIALNVLTCVGIIFAFHVFDAVGVALGKAGKLFPFASAWVGNILFSLGALMNIEKANY